MPEPATQRSQRARAAWIDGAISALNGAVGDTLHARGNGLEIAMAFHDADGPLALEAGVLAAMVPAPTGKLSILVHGLGVNERFWRYREDPTLDYGRLLHRDLGFTPFYLRYNTGLHISQNGRRLAALLEQLLHAYPRRVEDLTLIGHSMGGLVLRSACHYGVEADHAWPRAVARMFTLGSPHQGAPLEQVVHLATGLLRWIAHPTTRVPADIINARSAGVKDLRYGYTRDDDWTGHDPDALLRNGRQPVPLLPHATHYVVAGSLTRNPEHWLTLALGDALVRVPSAHGESRRSAHHIPFAARNRALVAGVTHNALAYSPVVYDEIRRRCAPTGSEQEEPA
jgi:triacylglycerol lipase